MTELFEIPTHSSDPADLVPIFSVSELSQALKRSVEDQFGFVRVRGEVSGLKKHTSGHIYYTLKDDTSVMDAVSWRGSYSSNPVQLEDGLEVIATGRLTTYPARSKYQLVVERYEATGQGALLKLLEERKQKLAAEGLFSAARKKPLPPFPRTIGVVTSPTGAVIRDILHRISDRFPCHVIVWPVLVQGPGAAEQIAAAIEGFNALAQQQQPDVIIVARGGGSLEDLWAFNEEVVVRAVAKSQIPLVSAVGHETDTTLIDFASDLRAPTPTGAAELVVPVLMDLWNYIQDRNRRMADIMRQGIENRQHQLSGLERGLPDPRRLLEESVQRLDDWTERLNKSLPTFCQGMADRLKMLFLQLKKPTELLTLSQERLAYLSTRLEQASFHTVLERGFCLATDAQGHPISSAAKFPTTEPVSLLFKDGAVDVMRLGGKLPPKAKKKTNTSDQEIPKLF